MTEADADQEGRLYRAASWIDRATNECRPNDFDARFIYYWIAFNALYGQAKYKEENRQGEEASIHAFLGKMARVGSEAALRAAVGRLEGTIVELLKNQFLRKEYWADGFQDDLDDAIHAAERDVRRVVAGSGSVVGLLKHVFDCLYVLRIQLFHGCAKAGSSANRASLEPAIAVVQDLVPMFIEIVKRAEPGEDWGPLPYPAWGRAGHPAENRTRCFDVRH